MCKLGVSTSLLECNYCKSQGLFSGLPAEALILIVVLILGVMLCHCIWCALVVSVTVFCVTTVYCFE
jgi:hypothetical protein